MTEKKLQYNIIVWFSQKYPEKQGLLFEVNNDTYSRNHAMSRRAMGMIKGASDLVLFHNNFAGIELKSKQKRHETQHIKQQIEWGGKIIENGGFYLICSDENDIKTFIESLINGKIDKVKCLQKRWLDYVNHKIEAETKTITI